ncbi:hypothetical protein STAFG_8037 [Streptomyces afghaniensis 772]|uniref:Uncharacterized protein n=1 Tax=Streptomyces afghaniensis 772 TaxID=1283301 RepID=S4NAF7_9ACTN|nr:hypothetical protein STAFG_8037 [Streptomyces afghaniensis 772]
MTLVRPRRKRHIQSVGHRTSVTPLASLGSRILGTASNVGS